MYTNDVRNMGTYIPHTVYSTFDLALLQKDKCVEKHKFIYEPKNLPHAAEYHNAPYHNVTGPGHEIRYQIWCSTAYYTHAEKHVIHESFLLSSGSVKVVTLDLWAAIEQSRSISIPGRAARWWVVILWPLSYVVHWRAIECMYATVDISSLV